MSTHDYVEKKTAGFCNLHLTLENINFRYRYMFCDFVQLFRPSSNSFLISVRKFYKKKKKKSCLSYRLLQFYS